jgi:hypothetical protein
VSHACHSEGKPLTENHEHGDVRVWDDTPVDGVVVSAEIDAGRPYIIIGSISGRLLDRQLSIAQARLLGRALLDAANTLDAP